MNTQKFLLTHFKKLLAGSLILSGATFSMADDVRFGVFSMDPEPVEEAEASAFEFPAFPQRLLRTAPVLDVRDNGFRGVDPRGLSVRPAVDESRDRNLGVRPASARELRLRPRLNELPFVRPGDDFAAPDRTRIPVRERSDGPATDPFIPAPVPRGLLDEESEKINELLTRRYSNPVTVRVIRSLTPAKAVELFAEVSRRIDDRSLEPTSYDVRVRRALRNLGLALDNPAFNSGLGLSSDSFRTDAFRELLGRLAGRGPITSYEGARKVMMEVMTAAGNVPGLGSSVAAWEFTCGSVDTLDQFSGLEPEDPASRSGAELSGVRSASLEEEITGVGVEVREHSDGLVVMKALRGGPAAEAGLATGDIITRIDGRNLAGMLLAKSTDLMRGAVGSRMTLRIVREGRGEKDVVLVRRRIRVWTVNDVRMLPGTSTGYLSLSRFSKSSTAELDSALMELHRSGMKSLVLDLRGNPGGLLTTCVEISDRFLPCGTIVSTRGRLGGDNMVEKAKFDRTWSTPVVVLIDGNSASASEIFAAAIQENKRGVVVGSRSYGKGSVQTHFPLNAIAGDLRITTALFYSPNGRRMAGEGVLPDVTVEDADGPVNGDRVLEEALRIAADNRLREMALASAKCRPSEAPTPRSSSLEHLSDPTHLAVETR
ncbi:MAG: S41 family peptidase [Planctomycetaceae bacterium]